MRFHKHIHRMSSVIPAVLAVFLASAAFGVQEQQDPALTAPTKRRVHPTDGNSRNRPPLLREGGYLLRTPGEVFEDSKLGVHLFKPLHVEDGGIRRELILLPSRAMDDLIHLLSAHEEKEKFEASLFEVTGKVLVYRGRNFLLPDVVTIMNAPASEVQKELTPDAIGAAPVQEEMPLETNPDALAESIENRLEARIGAVPRSLDIAGKSVGQPGPAMYRAGTNIQNRRGHVIRDPSSGTWRFVFEGSSMTMELLPCMKLQGMEQTTKQRVVPVPVTVSGRVTAFHGRNYLLPTAFGPAREGRGIGP